MCELNRQQLCATLQISDSHLYRLELSGLPFTPIGKRSKRYNLDEVKTWLREKCQSGQIKKAERTSPSWSAAKEFTDACRKVNLRVMPSS